MLVAGTARNVVVVNPLEVPFRQNAPGWMGWKERFSMFRVLTELLRGDRGATAIEYGLIAALVSVAAISAFQLVGTNLSSTFHTIATKL